MLERFLFLWLTLLSLAALKWDAWIGRWDPFVALSPYKAPLFAVTMFFVGGLLPRDEVLVVLRRWPLVLAGTAVQYLSMPLIAWSVATLGGLEGDAFFGTILVGCVPGAMASNVLTLTARGNTSYSVGLTTSATLCSPLVVPLALYVLLAATSVDSAALARRAFFSLLWMVVGPVVAGYTVVRWAERAGNGTGSGRMAGVARLALHRMGALIAGHGAFVANVAILWIIASVVADNRDRLSHPPVDLMLGLLAINVLGYAAGWWAGMLIRLGERERRALTLEIGMQNAGLGAVLAQQLFPGRPGMALPVALYTFGCMLTGVLLAQWWANSSPMPAVEAGVAHSASGNGGSQ